MTAVHVVVPDGIDDPEHPTGGNVYDRRLVVGLEAAGWDVRVHAVGGSWPTPDGDACARLTEVIATAPDDGLVLVDGLIASVAPAVLVPHARRLGLVVLVHMARGDRPDEGEVAEARAAEGAVLSAAAAVVTTSWWTRQRLIDLYCLPPDRVHVARPGVDAAAVAPGTADGGALLCVGAVARHKGHDVLLAALAEVRRPAWRCSCVGALDADPGYVEELRRLSASGGIADRVRFDGPMTGDGWQRSYAAADLLVVASRMEAYGMVITEALARGIPVVASSVGGVPEAMGATPDGRRPGLLVPPDDVPALAGALGAWLGDDGLRRSLRTAARERRPALGRWDETIGNVATVLAEVACGEPDRVRPRIYPRQA